MNNPWDGCVWACASNQFDGKAEEMEQAESLEMFKRGCSGVYGQIIYLDI